MEEYFSSQGCEFIEKNGRRVRYRAQCGHEYETRLDVFKHGSARKCITCSRIRPRCDQHRQEADSFIEVTELLKLVFDVKQTTEGCLADFIVKPWNCTEDKWLQVQFKTTLKAIHGVYTFSMHKKYPSCVVLCQCIHEKRLWLFKGYDVPEQSLGIRPNGKYAGGEVTTSFTESLLRMYNTYYLSSLRETMVPVGQAQRIEYTYRLKRERFYPDSNFESPIVQYRSYDFVVNSKKYQEKVASFKNNRYIFKYKPGGSDFYFVHIPDTDYFFVIPQHVLENNKTPSGSMTININKHHMWYMPYRHTYTRRDFAF